MDLHQVSARLCFIPVVAFSLLAADAAFAQDKPADKPKSDETKPDENKSDDNASKKPKIKKYEEVITKDAVTKVGLFRVHRVDDSLFFEIPVEALNTDLLWVTQIAETTAGSSYAGMPVQDRVVRWEQRGDKILLRDVRYGIRADTTDPIAQAVKNSNLAPIIKTFDIKAYGPDKAPVIDVTDLFKRDVPEFSARNALNAGAMDDARSFIDEFKAFPKNINIRVLASYAPGGKNSGDNGGPQSSGISAVVQHSMVKLPDVPDETPPFRFTRGIFHGKFHRFRG